MVVTWAPSTAAERQEARAAGLAVHEDGARPAAASLAADLRARDVELVSQRVQERS